MPLSVYAKNLMLDRFIAGGSALTIYASMHTGAPASTGANEATGGSPAYARKLLAWAGAASGAKQTNATVVFDLAAGTYNNVGYWDALTTGNYLGYDLITPATFTVQDVFALTIAQLNLMANPSA